MLRERCDDEDGSDTGHCLHAPRHGNGEAAAFYGDDVVTTCNESIEVLWDNMIDPTRQSRDISKFGENAIEMTYLLLTCA